MHLKYGFVDKTKPGFVIVSFPGDDQLLSGWMPVLLGTTHDDQDQLTVPVKSQVACLVDEHANSGVCLGAIYSEADPPPFADANVWGKRFKDGTVITYDKGAKKLNVHHADGPSVEISGAEVLITGDLHVTGKVTAQGDVQSSGNISTALGDIQAGAIALKLHKHPTAGMGPPSPPIP